MRSIAPFGRLALLSLLQSKKLVTILGFEQINNDGGVYQKVLKCAYQKVWKPTSRPMVLCNIPQSDPS